LSRAKLDRRTSNKNKEEYGEELRKKKIPEKRGRTNFQ
jgi:hypothetical protein